MKSKETLTAKPIRTIDCGEIKLGYGGDLQVRISGTLAPIDGSSPPKEAFPTRQGHSYVQGFVDALFAQAASRYNTSGQAISKIGPNIGVTYVNKPISVHTAGAKARITIPGTTSILDDQRLAISEATFDAGSVSAVNNSGVWANYISSGVYDLYTDEALTIGYDTTADGAGVYDVNSGHIWTFGRDVTGHHAAPGTFSTPELWVGNSNQAVNILDDTLIEWNSHLYAGAQAQAAVSQPVVSSTQSTITLSRLFNNTSGGAITIEEMGVISLGSQGTTFYGVFLARDTQTIVIPDAQTLTLNYEFITTIDLLASNNEGGFTQNFNELLYRHMAQASRTVQDHLNANNSEDENYLTFGLTGPTGVANLRPYNADTTTGGFGMWRAGIVLGTDDGSVLPIAQDNYYLGTAIEHGRDPGELFYYGSIADKLEVLGGSKGTVTLDTGGAGSVDGITVNGVAVMSGAEAFATDLTTTATNVAANITAHTSAPNYTATAEGRVISIFAATDTGAGADTFAVVSSCTTITSTDVAMANGNSASFTIRRLIKNDSGETITATEAALMCNVGEDFDVVSCIVRKIHDGGGAPARPSPTVIADGEVVEAVFTIRATVV